MSDVVFADNSNVIQLLAAKPHGIFSLLEEQGMLGERATSETFKAVLYQTHQVRGGTCHVVTSW